MNIIFFTVTSIMGPLQVKCENIFLSMLCEGMRLQSDNDEILFLLLKVPPSGNMKQPHMMKAFNAVYLF